MNLAVQLAAAAVAVSLAHVTAQDVPTALVVDHGWRLVDAAAAAASDAHAVVQEHPAAWVLNAGLYLLAAAAAAVVIAAHVDARCAGLLLNDEMQ